MKQKELKFTRHSKDSKNCNRYTEQPSQDGYPPVLKQLYVSRWFCGDAQNIEITIKVPDPQ